METQVVPETQDDGYKWIALAIASLGTLVGILTQARSSSHFPR